MNQMPMGNAAVNLVRRVSPLLGDVLAYGLLFAILAATASLPKIEVSLAVLPLAAAIMMVSVAFGRATAIGAALLLMLTLRLETPFGINLPLSPGELLSACVAGFGLAVLREQMRRNRRLTAEAYVWADLQARRRVTDRTDTVAPVLERSQVRQPTATLTAKTQTGAEADCFADAFRCEGGV